MNTHKHNFTRVEIMAGALVLLAVLALVGFIAIVMGMRPPRAIRGYHASFSKTIGLNPGADVRFGGVKAGYVHQIAPDPDDQSLIRVTAHVDAHIPVNEASVATIEQTTLTAEKHLEISTGTPDAPLLPEGASMKSITLSGGFIEMPDLGGVITRVEKVLDDVVEFLGVDLALERDAQGEQSFARLSDIADAARTALDEGAGILQDTRHILSREDGTISEILSKIRDIEDAALAVVHDISGMLDENRPLVRQGLADASELIALAREAAVKVADELDVILDALETTLAHASGLTGSARAVIEENRLNLEQTITDIRHTVRYLRSFSRTMAEEPHAVIRGKKTVGR